MEKKSLKPMSVRLLYDGMHVADDIYDAGSARLLAKAGTVLSTRLIEAIKNHNNHKDIIYVSATVQAAMIKNECNVEVAERKQLEKETGYSEATDKVFETLNDLTQTKEIKEDKIKDVAEELSYRVENTSPSVIVTLVSAMAPVDEYLQRHCVNLSLLNGLYGKWSGLSKSKIDNLILIGLLHDCGKALIPPQILKAPRKLTISEFEVIKMHARYTYDLLEDFPEEIRLAASCHHEKMDGSGYPRGLRNDEIPFESKVTTITDVYDAAISRRSYKRESSPFHVLSILKSYLAGGFDPKFVDFFVYNMAKELVDKPMEMTDGSIGITRFYELDKIEFPTVEINGAMVKTNENFHCVSLFTTED